MTPRQYFNILRDRWQLIVAGLVLGLVVAGAVTLFMPRVYTAQATILVSAKPAASDAALTELPAQRMATYVALLTSNKILETVGAELQPKVPASVLAANVRAAERPGTALLITTVTDSSPARAAEIANLVAEQFVANVDALERPANAAPAAAAPAAPGAPAPAAPAEGTVPAVSAQLFDAAVPPVDATSPDPLLNFSLGAILGLLVGVALAIGRNALDPTVRSRDALAAAVGAPVLGVVDADVNLTSRPLAARDAPDAALADDFRTLRTNLQFGGVEVEHPVLVVTSADSTDGKTSTLCNLAVVMAAAEKRVLVVDADLRHPEVARFFGADWQVGLTDVLTGSRPVEQAVQRCGPYLSVLPSGPVPSNPSELLSSAAVANLIDHLRGSCDYILIDSSPLASLSDATALAKRADGVLLVARQGRTTTVQIEAARSALEAVSARFLGAVMTTGQAKDGAERRAEVPPKAGLPPTSVSAVTDLPQNGPSDTVRLPKKRPSPRARTPAGNERTP